MLDFNYSKDFAAKMEELKKYMQQEEAKRLVPYPLILTISDKLNKGEELSDEEKEKMPYVIPEIDRLLAELESNNKEIRVEVPDIEKIVELCNLMPKLENGEKMSLSELALIANSTDLEKKMARRQIIDKQLLIIGKESHTTYYDNLAIIGRIKVNGEDAVRETLDKLGLNSNYKI